MRELVISAGPEEYKNIEPGQALLLDVSVWDGSSNTSQLDANVQYYYVATTEVDGINGVLLSMKKTASRLFISLYRNEFLNEHLPKDKELIFHIRVVDVLVDPIGFDKPYAGLESIQELGSNIQRLNAAYRQQLAIIFKKEMEEIFNKLQNELSEESSLTARDIIKDHTLQLLQSLHFNNNNDEQLSVEETQKSTSAAYEKLKTQLESTSMIGQLQRSRERALKIKQANLTEREEEIGRKTEVSDKREKELHAWKQKELKDEQKEMEERKRQMQNMMSQSLESNSATQDVVLKKGFLTKQGHVVKNWKKRYFLLLVPKTSTAASGGAVLYHDAFMYYYKNPQDEKPAGIIQIRGYDVKVTDPGTFDFSLVHPKEARNFNIKADTMEDMSDWVQAIKSATLI